MEKVIKKYIQYQRNKKEKNLWLQYLWILFKLVFSIWVFYDFLLIIGYQFEYNWVIALENFNFLNKMINNR